MMFIETFRMLSEYHFLWKFEANSTPTQLPPNVRILPWLPQSDILAHPKTKAIIAHGGSLSTQEAVFRGVQLLIIPFVYDQVRVCNLVTFQIFGQFIAIKIIPFYFPECSSIKRTWNR